MRRTVAVLLYLGAPTLKSQRPSRFSRSIAEYLTPHPMERTHRLERPEARA